MIEVKGECIVDGTKLSPKGYNQQYRKYWRYKNGSVPKGLQIDHVCRNKACINTEHMELVTLKENISRAPTHNINRTHCPRGHEYKEGNIYYFKTKSGVGRSCRECKLMKGCYA